MSILMFVMFLLPSIFKLTVPLSLLLATTITVLRMSADHELEGWLASGVSVLRLAVAPLFLGIMVMSMSAFSALFLEPYSRQEWRKFKWMHARTSVEAIIENRLREKTFLSQLFQTGGNNIAFYADSLSENQKDFTGVFLALTNKDAPYSWVLVAKAGSLQKESRAGFSDYVFTLRNGHYYYPQNGKSVPFVSAIPGALAASGVPSAPGAVVASGVPSAPVPSLDWTVVKFDELKVSLVNLFQKQFDPGAFDANDIRSLFPREYLAELKDQRKKEGWRKDSRTIRNHSYFYENIVVPISCLFLPVIGLCLGVRDPRRKSAFAYLGLGLVVLVYYVSVMVCQQLASRFVAPPEITLVLPPLIMAALTTLLMRWRALYPPSVSFLEYFRSQVKRYVRRGSKA